MDYVVVPEVLFTIIFGVSKDRFIVIFIYILLRFVYNLWVFAQFVSVRWFLCYFAYFFHRKKFIGQVNEKYLYLLGSMLNKSY